MIIAVSHFYHIVQTKHASLCIKLWHAVQWEICNPSWNDSFAFIVVFKSWCTEPIWSTGLKRWGYVGMKPARHCLVFPSLKPSWHRRLAVRPTWKQKRCGEEKQSWHMVHAHCWYMNDPPLKSKTIRVKERSNKKRQNKMAATSEILNKANTKLRA